MAPPRGVAWMNSLRISIQDPTEKNRTWIFSINQSIKRKSSFNPVKSVRLMGFFGKKTARFPSSANV